MSNQHDPILIPATRQAAVPSGDFSPVTQFTFENTSVRIVIIDGTEYFVAKDLAVILEFKNPRQAVRQHVNKRDRRGVPLRDTIGRTQTLLAVNESGMYALIFGSENPKAQDLKHWVTSEVLPTLRKTGRYGLGKTPQLLEQIVKMLRGRGVAKTRQLNRIIVHRDDSFSFRVGHHWVRHVEPTNPHFALSHAFKEGLALGCLAGSPEVKRLIH